MEILFELLFGALQIVLELGLQLVFEIFAELGLHAVREPFKPRRTLNPWIAALGYGIFGALAGLLSLAVVSHSWIENPTLQQANLLITPLLAGASMALFGAWRRRRGQELIRLDRFAYGFLFALAMSSVRYAAMH
jgi:hypothetical protein